ncbi:MAG: hypothetical protein AAF528_07610 [Cyanobacteria bacterium P01_C01_bin.121]
MTTWAATHSAVGGSVVSDDVAGTGCGATGIGGGLMGAASIRTGGAGGGLAGAGKMSGTTGAGGAAGGGSDGSGLTGSGGAVKLGSGTASGLVGSD